MRSRTARVRRSLARLRRRESAAAREAAATPRPIPPPSPAALPPAGRAIGWDLDATPDMPAPAELLDPAPLTAQVLALWSDPRVGSLTVPAAAALLGRPRPEVETTLDALVQAGDLSRTGGSIPRYTVPPHRKAELEALFHAAAHELGETNALVRSPAEVALAPALDDDEPRLPVTAGLLSLFLPGTGQLLNGDVGRASLVFAVWSLALLTHLSPIWTFVALYAGAEAFFTAKIRAMERKLALEAADPRPTKTPQPLKSG